MAKNERLLRVNKLQPKIKAASSVEWALAPCHTPGVLELCERAEPKCMGRRYLSTMPQGHSAECKDATANIIYKLYNRGYGLGGGANISNECSGPNKFNLTEVHCIHFINLFNHIYAFFFSRSH